MPRGAFHVAAAVCTRVIQARAAAIEAQVSSLFAIIDRAEHLTCSRSLMPQGGRHRQADQNTELALHRIRRELDTTLWRFDFLSDRMF